MKRRTWMRRSLLLLLCLTVLAGCGQGTAEEQREIPEGQWADNAPALYHEGRFYHWIRVFDELPHEDESWSQVGEVAGTSWETEPREGYIHANPNPGGSDPINMEEGAAGEIWASPDYPDVRYVHLTGGYHSTLWVGMAVSGLYQGIFCWDGRLYTAPGKGSEAELETLPPGCTEEGRLLYDTVDRIPTEDGAATGGWSGEVRGPYACLPAHLSSTVWRGEDGTLYLGYLRGSRDGEQNRYVPARPLTAEAAGELTIPEQFLPLP